MGGKGSTGGAKYRGSIVGVVGAGPMDWLNSLQLDGATVWPTDRSWADDIINIPVETVRRKSNRAYATFATPHGLRAGNKFVLNGLSGALVSFNAPGATNVHDANDYRIEYVNYGFDVAETSVPDATGVLTKVVTYDVNDLVRFGSLVYRCIFAHDSTPDKAPPNVTYWAPYSVQRAGSPDPYPFTVVTSKFTDHTNYGQAYFYWGTAAQEWRGASVFKSLGHPPYRRQALLELEDFLFGIERQGPQNVTVVCGRNPQQTLIAGASALLDDGQANPMAVLAEMLSDPVYGLGLAAGFFDSTSWQAIADELRAMSSLTYISAYVDQQTSMRELVGKLLAYYDGWLRFNSAGAVEAGRFLHNAAPPAFTPATTIDFHDVKEEIDGDAPGWSDTFNLTVCKFQDRDRAYKDAGRTAPSGYNRQIVGEPRRASLDRPWITREPQALAHAAEWGKINAQRKLEGSLIVRAEKAASILQGTLFKLNHDAMQLAVACRCTQKIFKAPPAGLVSLRFETERGLAPLPFTPTPIQIKPGVQAVEAISQYLLWQIPPALGGGDDFVLSVLATRRSALTRGLRAWLKMDDAGNFYDLGEQHGWPVFGTLAQNYGVPASGTTAQRSKGAFIATLKVVAHGYSTGLHISVSGLGGTGYNVSDAPITVLDADHFTYPITDGGGEGVTADANGVVQPLVQDDTETLQVNMDDWTLQADLDNISATQTEDAINDSALLVCLFSAADPTQFEICSLAGIRLDSGVYKLKVRRAKFGTQQTAFVTADLAWIIYRSDLVTYTHERFAAAAQAGTAAVFRLQAFTANSEADLTDSDQCPDIAFNFTDPWAPKVVWTSLLDNGVAIADFTATFLPTDVFTFGFEMFDANSDLIHGTLCARLGSVELTLWSQIFPPSASQFKSVAFSLPEGHWRIFAIAKDASGRVIEYELRPVGGGSPVSLNVQAGGGAGTCATPVADPPAGDYPTTQHIALSCSTSGATIKYSRVALGAAPGAYSTYSSPIGVTLTGPSSKWSIYTYATKAGLTDSAVVRNDYWWSSGA
jgi:hypothetical protein